MREEDPSEGTEERDQEEDGVTEDPLGTPKRGRVGESQPFVVRGQAQEEEIGSV